MLRDLSLVCNTSDPPTDPEITMIEGPLTTVSRKANDRAGEALNTMRAQAAAAFKDNPDAASVTSALDGFRDVIEQFGRNTMLIESAGDVEVTACTAAETVPQASEALGVQVQAAIDAFTAFQLGEVLLDKILTDTGTACAAVRVVPPISPSQMRKKTGSPTNRFGSGGATLTIPKKVDVGKKAVKLPVTITKPNTGYGSVTVRRGPKGIVATGGQVSGSFGLWLTVPAKTQPGIAIVTFTSADGVVKGALRFR